MKISNKTLIVFILVVVGFVLSWFWMNQQRVFNNNADNTNRVVDKDNTNENSAEKVPSIVITFPSNQTALNPGPLMVQYALSGFIDQVDRIDLILNEKGESLFQRTGSFSRTTRTGSQIFPSLEEGEYLLMARLIKKDGTYFENPFSQNSVTFKVKEKAQNSN